MMKKAYLLAVLLTTLWSAAFARPFTQSDLVSLSQIRDLSVSHDGRWLVWEQTDEDSKADLTRYGLWRLDLHSPSAAPEKIADRDGVDVTNAEFGADGQLYFLTRDPTSKGSLYRISMEDLQPVLVLGSQDLSGFTLSPAGDAVLAWADRSLHARSLGDTMSRLTENGGARTYDQLPIRHWNQWAGGNRSQLFLVALRDGRAEADGCAVAPTLVGDVPSKPNGGKEAIAWAPDGLTIYFSLREAGRIEPLSTNSDIYAKPATCTAAPVDLTISNKAADMLPTVSPDGRWLAWTATARPGYSDDRQVVWLRELATNKVRPLTEKWDRSADSLTWSLDSKSLYITANDTLDHPIFSVGISDGAVRRLTQSGHIAMVTALPEGSIIFEKDSLIEPPDLWRQDLQGTETRLTRVNAAKLSGIEWPEVMRFKFAGAKGDTVWGLTLRPPQLPDSEKAPIVLVVHGGPQATLGDSWFSRWPLNLALYADHGYGVVSIDFHGSTGHGQAFTDSVNRDWGGKPLTDLRLGLASAVARFSYLDETNACAVGGSYGGYMMNWIEGHWPKRFKCLIQHDGVFDERGMTYETDELAQDRWDFGDQPYYLDPKSYERWNPVNAVAAWRTPELVITGERDFRTPSGQAIAAFTALQERNIPSRLIVFPGEGHYEVKGRNSLQWYDEAFKWLDRWTSLNQIRSIAADAQLSSQDDKVDN